MPSFPTNDSNGAILGKVGEWLEDTFVLQAHLEKNPVSITDAPFNAVVGEDNTAAIDAAWAFAASERRPLYFPASPDGEWLYNGSGFTNTYTPVIGAGSERTKVRLGAGKYLFSVSTGSEYLLIRDIGFYGGAGVFRHTFTGINTLGMHVVKDCVFRDYTGAAFTSDSEDMPYWRFENCEFRAANSQSTIGIALPGPGSDHTHIKGCVFLRNKIHIKVRGGINAKVRDNDFIRWDTNRPNGPAIALWLVPAVDGTNGTGTGFESSGNKYGNENLVAGDLHIVIADELAGTGNGGRLPDLTTVSANAYHSLTSSNDTVSGSGNALTPFVFSTSPNLHGAFNIHNLNIVGSMPTELVRYLDPSGMKPNNRASQVVGPLVGANAGTTQLAPPLSNAYDTPYIVDPAAKILHSGAIPPYHAGDPSGYRNLLQSTRKNVNDWVIDHGKTAAVDSLGGSNAVEIAYTNGGQNVRAGLDPMTPGELVWLEIDLKPGGTNPPQGVMVSIEDRTAGATVAWHITRGIRFRGNSSWFRIRIPFLPRTAGSGASVMVTSVTAGNVVIGRPRVYHAREPQIDALVLTAPSGTRYRLGVADDGSLTTTSL